jgi:hypothetical protein
LRIVEFGDRCKGAQHRAHIHEPAHPTGHFHARPVDDRDDGALAVRPDLIPASKLPGDFAPGLGFGGVFDAGPRPTGAGTARRGICGRRGMVRVAAETSAHKIGGGEAGHPKDGDEETLRVHTRRELAEDGIRKVPGDLGCVRFLLSETRGDNDRLGHRNESKLRRIA